ncbi:MAG: hypothetical protein J7K53_14170 [Bacteroidales bacterium]|nr:hypothetical protein [Bacteroidales bacterium]
MFNAKLVKLLFGRLLFIVMILFISQGCFHQRKSRTVRKAENRVEQADIKREKVYEKERKDGLKHQYEIQTKEVRERMKQSRKNAEKFNRQMRKHEPFFKRLIRKIFKK